MKPEELLRAPVSPSTLPPSPVPSFPAAPLAGFPAADRSRAAPPLFDRECFSVVYRSDPETLRAAVPEPLEVAEPLVRFEIANLAGADGHGSRTEAYQVVAVRYGGEDGEYLHAVHLGGGGTLPAGRAPSSSPGPATAGTPRLVVEEDLLVGTLDCGAQRVATATMPYEYAPMNLREAREQITRPTFAVRPAAGTAVASSAAETVGTGTGAAGIGGAGTGGSRGGELVRTELPGITVRRAWRGPAWLQLFEHALAPLAELPVLEVVSASHVLADLTPRGAGPRRPGERVEARHPG
ncbi:acetoacetate decarboxylase family protein [Actinomadura logoneensis]|nr:acetoacetate decarboxylase family protein [Actinomadura logoneensis]